MASCLGRLAAAASGRHNARMGLPMGTVTMLFSDMEGSTRLLARLGATYGDLLSAQRRLLRSVFGAHRGTEMGTEGDSFFVVFASAVDAVSACAEGQRALAGHAWPQGVAPLIRMGLHTGEPTRHEDGYIGMDVHRAARIAASAHGGQVVMSEATRQLVAGQLADAGRGSQEGEDPADLGVADLGWHRLKDIAEAEHLYQLLIPGLPDTFPPLKSLGNRGSLPRPPTPFIARSAELRDVRGLLAGADAVRLVTVTGPGGVGKTRLALAAAGSVADRFGDGVFFVRLAPVTEAAVMWTTIAEALGVTGDGRSPPTFFEHIADLQALLVLDNLEQLPEAGQVIADLLDVAPRVALLATSRRPLHVLGEHEYPLGPLPPPGSLPPDQPQEGAVELFVQYAKMARPDFRLTSENAGDVAAICDRLDGLPLALEIAAARSRLLSPRALLARLDSSLEFEAGTAGRPERHRTLRDTILWSYDLLGPELQAFFRSMGAFAGGCDLAAISAVASGGADAFDQVAELADAALLRLADGPDGEPRARMLQTVQAFARAALHQAGEWDEIRNAHASFYADLAGELSSRLEGPNALAARDRIEAELENIRVALGWCLDQPADGNLPPPEQLTTGLRLCQALSWFWYAFGYTAEGHRWQRRAVAVASDRGRPGPGRGPARAGRLAAAARRDRRGERRADHLPADPAGDRRPQQDGDGAQQPRRGLLDARRSRHRPDHAAGEHRHRTGDRRREPGVDRAVQPRRVRGRGQQLRARHRAARAGARDRHQARERLGLRGDPVQPDGRDAAGRPGRRGLRVAARPGG